MSNTATQETFQGFVEASVAELPQLACIGYVEEVPDGKLSSSENYIVQPIKIRAHGPGRSLQTNLLYRPDWLEQGFDPQSLLRHDDPTTGGKEGSKMLMVYRRNISAKGSVTSLRGLAGSEENFNRLAAKLLSLADKTAPSVSAALREFFAEQEETEIGYVLRQRRDKAGEDENGKQQYELANGYEVNEYFYPTDVEKAKLIKRAARTKDGKFKIAFDTDSE